MSMNVSEEQTAFLAYVFKEQTAFLAYVSEIICIFASEFQLIGYDKTTDSLGPS